MAKDKKIEGVDLYGDVVPVKESGALYQMVEGDPTNLHFQETIQKGAREWANETGNHKASSVTLGREAR